MAGAIAGDCALNRRAPPTVRSPREHKIAVNHEAEVTGLAGMPIEAARKRPARWTRRQEGAQALDNRGKSSRRPAPTPDEASVSGSEARRLLGGKVQRARNNISRQSSASAGTALAGGNRTDRNRKLGT